jgi:hypothetical protein
VTLPVSSALGRRPEVLAHLKALAGAVQATISKHVDPRQVHRHIDESFELRSEAITQLPAIVSVVKELRRVEHCRVKRYPDVGEEATRTPTEHAELLSSLWFAMYFWGAPFEPAWEQVRRIVDDIGGYPGGQCLNKALGDIFRRTRQIHERGNLSEVDARPGILIYSRRPMAVLPFHLMPPFRHVIEPVRAGDGFDELAELGRAYYWMQLRLCVLQHVPITYIVMAEALRESYQRFLRSAQEPSVEQWAKQLADWTRKTLGDPAKPAELADCVRLYIADKIPEGIPMCALGFKAGIYVLPPESGKDSHSLRFPILGNRISRALLETYREGLTGKGACLDQAIRIANDQPALEDIFQRLIAESIAP